MTECQELYNELTTKIKELKIKHQELKKKKDKVVKEHRELEKNLLNQEQKLKDLEEKQNNMLTNSWKVIAFYTGLIFTITLIVSWGIATIYIPQLTKILSTIIINLNELAIITLLGLITIPGIFVIELIPAVLIMRILVKRKVKKIRNSEEYQNILKQQEDIKKEIEQTQYEEKNKSEEVNKAIEIYLHTDTELTIKKTLVNYIEKELLKSQTCEDSQIKQEVQQEKTYTRRKIQDFKNQPKNI